MRKEASGGKGLCICPKKEREGLLLIKEKQKENGL